MDDNEYKTKDIERLLGHEIDNWIRYGKSRDYLPASFRCPLGFVYQPALGEVYAPRYVIRVDEKEALLFERVVLALPKRIRQAFVMHHLDRAHILGHIRIVKGRMHKAQIMQVSARQYHNLVRQAHEMIFQVWTSGQLRRG